MCCQNLTVAGIDDSRLVGSIEEVVRVAEKVLIEGVRNRNQDDQGLTPAATHSTTPLPGAGDTSGIADEEAGIQSAYVDPKFQGRGGHDPCQLFGEQPSLDRPAFVSRKACSIGSKPTAKRRIGLPCPHGD